MSSSLILCNNDPFLDQIVTCNKKWTTGKDWEEAPKHFPKPNLHQRKVMVIGGLLPVWSTTALWIPAKPLHLRSMLSKSMRCTKLACSWHWSTEWAQSFSTKTLDHSLHNQCFKNWTNWATKFYLIHSIHLTSRQMTTTSGISTTSFRENASTTRRRRKMLSKRADVTESQGKAFYATGIKLFLMGKMCWL